MFVICDWQFQQLDTKTTFLHGAAGNGLQHPIFTASSGSFCLSLVTLLYVLKQSRRSNIPVPSFGCFSSALVQFGMTCCKVDHSIFFLHSSVLAYAFIWWYILMAYGF